MYKRTILLTRKDGRNLALDLMAPNCSVCQTKFFFLKSIGNKVSFGYSKHVMFLPHSKANKVVRDGPQLIARMFSLLIYFVEFPASLKLLITTRYPKLFPVSNLVRNPTLYSAYVETV